MTPEQVLSYKPNVLTQRQRESYFESGYLLLERIIPTEIIERLRRVTAEKVEETRRLTKSDAVSDLEPGHNANKPKLRRLSSPCDHHPAYWDYATRPLVLDIVTDLVGPNVKFHHSKLNFKASDGGAEVKWHQDIQFWPHTNYSRWSMREGSKVLPSIIKVNSCHWPPGSFSGGSPIVDRTNVRRPVISLSRIVSSGGLGSAAGSFIGSGAPATTTRASGPVGNG
jgi:hypothetical protein